MTVFSPEIETDAEFTNETWKCSVKIEWPGFLCEKLQYGGDAYQALELSLRLVPTLIAATNECRSRDLALHKGDLVLDSTTIREFFHARILGDV